MKPIIAILAPPSGAKCDFCSYPQAYASYPCEDFVAARDPIFGEHLLKGNWAACRECDSLIRAENWNGLLDRSTARFKEDCGVIPPGFREHVRQIHEGFRKHRRLEC